jgi:leucyl aminopeptidase
MDVTITKISLPKTGALATGVVEGKKLTGLAASWDKKSRGALSRAAKANRFEGKPGQILDVLSPAGFSVNRIILLGVGKAASVQEATARNLGGRLASHLMMSGEKSVSIAATTPDESQIDDIQFATLLGLGAKLRSYRFDVYRTRLRRDQKPSLSRLSVMVDDVQATRERWKDLSGVADGVFFARDLVSEPANKLFPKEFADRVSGLKDLGVKVEILNVKKMTELGMGALLGVGQGSERESQLAVMQWSGSSKKDEAPIAFVGKGVTFDTGGISLKPAAGMGDMKYDMGGAGAVAGVMHAIAARKAKANVVGILGLVENMPDGKAQRPGDVVTSMSGQTIEVLNTDAEGRLVLADALWYCQDRFKPKFMVDLATLTGAMVVSLGSQMAGVFSNNDELAERLTASGKASDELLWRFPMGEAYDRLINSPIADVANIGGRDAGSITAAQFLKRFTNDTPWAHLDIAGVAWAKSPKAICPKGASGFGVRLLDRLVADYYED